MYLALLEYLNTLEPGIQHSRRAGTEVKITQCIITFTEPDEGQMSCTTATIQQKLL